MAEENISENNKRIAKNTIYMYIRMLVMLFISLFTARIVFNTLGVENFGIYNVVGSVIVFFSFLNNGLSLATRRYITAEIAKGDEDSQQRVFNLAVIAHVYISVIILILAETVGLWAVNTFLNIPEERMFAANVVYQLSVFSAVLGIMQSPFGSAIVAYEKMSIYAYFSIFDVIFKLFIIFAVQWIPGDKLIVYGILLFMVSVCNILIYRIYCYKTFSMCKYVKVKDKHGLKEMFGYMGWSLAGQGTVVLTNQGVTMLINVFCGVVVNAAMGISNQITNIVSQFVSNFQVAFHPQITKYYVSKEFDALKALINRASRYSSYLVLIFFVPLLFQVDNFLTIWLGNYPEYSVEFCLLTVVCIYFEGLSGPLWMLIGSDTKIKQYQIIVSLIFSLNFIGSWIGLYLGFNPYHVITIRVFVSMLLIVARLILCKKRVPSFSIFKWINEAFLHSIYIVIIPIVIDFVLEYYIKFTNIWVELLSICAISVVITAACIYLLGLTKNEKKFVVNKIRGIIKR